MAIAKKCFGKTSDIPLPKIFLLYVGHEELKC